MKRVFSLVSILFLMSSCINSLGDRVGVKELPQSAYQNSFEKIVNDLKRNPENVKLVEQKLVFCEELDWPNSCIDALDIKKRSSGMSANLVRQYIEYFIANDNLENVAEFVIRWDDTFGLREEYYSQYIKGLISGNKYSELRKELPIYLNHNNDHDDLLIAANSYLASGDSLMSIYYFTKAFKSEGLPSEFKYTYPDLLLSINRPNRAYNAISSFLEHENYDTTYRLNYASLLYDSLNSSKSRSLLFPLAGKDTIAYIIADYYLNENLWDSAIMVLDTLIAYNPLNKIAHWKRARYYEERGWLSYSLRFFDQVIALDSLDSIAIDRKDLIKRKIAYLQRKKFEENKISVQQIRIKKRIINNE